MTKNEILSTAKTAREAEVLEYQINIDNYRLAIARIDATTYDSTLIKPMQDFRAQLSGLLAGAIVEQTKSQLMLDVISSQLPEVQPCAT